VGPRTRVAAAWCPATSTCLAVEAAGYARCRVNLHSVATCAEAVHRYARQARFPPEESLVAAVKVQNAPKVCVDVTRRSIQKSRARRVAAAASGVRVSAANMSVRDENGVEGAALVEAVDEATSAEQTRQRCAPGRARQNRNVRGKPQKVP